MSKKKGESTGGGPPVMHTYRYKGFGHYFDQFSVREHTFLVVAAAAVGIGAGLAAFGFRTLIALFRTIFFTHGWNLLGNFGPWRHYLLPVLPIAGALLLGPIIYYFPKESEGDGVPETIEAMALRGGHINKKTIVVKSFSAAICLGSGGSVGREGPIAQIGSAVGSAVGQVLKVPAEQMRIFVGCGAAGGIAATFNAPIAGVLFALEILLGDFAVRTFSPIVVSSVAATAVTRWLIGNHHDFILPVYKVVSFMELVPYAVLGVVAGLIAHLLLRTLYWCESFFERVPGPVYVKPAMGALCFGTIAIWYPEILGNGYEFMNLALTGKMLFKVMMALILLKLVATSLTLGSKGSGGLLAPSLFIGAMLGGTFGTILHGTFPSWTAHEGAYALVGMGAVLGAALHAPMMAIILLFELTNNYLIILPLMISVIIANLVARWLLPYSIYTFKLHIKGLEVDHGREVEVLRKLKVRDIMATDAVVVPENVTLKEIFNMMFSSGDVTTIWVNDMQGNLSGAISLQHLKDVMFVDVEGFDQLVLGRDLAFDHLVHVHPDDDLVTVTEKFEYRDLDELPVVERDNHSKLVGVVTRRTALNAYYKGLLKKQLSRED
jgi:CIC family chloride channel protein